MEVKAGRTLRDVIAQREAEDPSFRSARARFAPFAAIAREMVVTRMHLGLTQSQLAERMRTTKSAVSRMESGRQPMTVATLQRVSDALRTTFVISPSTSPPDESEGFVARATGVADARARTIRRTVTPPATTQDWLRVSVSPHPSERSWIVGPEVVGARTKAGVATTTEPTQEAAVEKARGLLLGRGGGELKVHRPDGSLREVRHVGSISRESKVLGTEG
jgi:transcriptional regulator with XRE-family HTH domain